MTTSTTRRTFLRISLASSALTAMSACTFIKGKDTTTLVLDVAKLRAYAEAGLNATAMILSLPPVAVALGAPAVAMITMASQALSRMLEAFQKQAGDKITVVYDSSDIRDKIDAILQALEDLSKDLRSAVDSISDKVDSSTHATITTSLEALSTIVSVFEALLSGRVAVSSTRPGRAWSAPTRPTSMTEAQALRQLGVM